MLRTYSEVEQLPVLPETDNTCAHDRRAVEAYKDSSSVVEPMSIESSAECSGSSRSMTVSRAWWTRPMSCSRTFSAPVFVDFHD